jgi:exonuclease VII small subunit
MSQAESINQKLDQLKTKLDWFYSDDFSLDTALVEYKAAVKLAQAIKSDLTKIQNEITVLKEDFSIS